MPDRGGFGFRGNLGNMRDRSNRRRVASKLLEFRWHAAAIAPWTWYVWRDLTAWTDGIAIMMPVLVAIALVVVVVVGIWRRQWRASVTGVSLLAFGVVVIVLQWTPIEIAEPTGGVRFTSANLETYWFSDNDFDFYLEQNPAAFVVASELSLSHQSTLRDRFSYFVDDVIVEQRNRTEPEPGDQSYKRYGLPSIGAYSDYPITELPDESGLAEGLPGFRLRLDLPDGPIIVYALHVPKPSLGDGLYQVGLNDHHRIADGIARSVTAETLPTVVIGDLNMTDRGGAFRTILSSGVKDGMRSSSARPTSNRGFWTNMLALRIDHLLVGQDLCTTDTRFDELAFSDHRAISALVGRCEP